MAIMRNNYVRAGATFFVLRGILNIIVSLGGVVSFYKTGPTGMFSMYGETLKPSQLTPAFEMASHIALNCSMILIGYGILAIWMAVHIWKGVRVSLWINTIMLGIADVSFIISLIAPGYIPLDQGIIGPAITTLAVLLTFIGFRKLDEDNALEKVTAGWVPLDRRSRGRD